MAIHPVASGSAPAAEQAVQKTRENQARKESELTPQQQAKQLQNRQILEAQASISLKNGDNSLALTLRTAIDAINERLAPELGDQAIERAYESGLDVSPEATAERIVSLTTAMFSSYQSIHPEDGVEKQASNFVEIIRGGIEQGFAEAREILDGLGVLEGDIAANIDRTFALVQEGLSSFLERFRSSDEQPAAAVEPAVVPDAED